MGSCYSGDRIAEDNTGITYNFEKPQQKYRLGKVSSLNWFYWIQTIGLRFCSYLCLIQAQRTKSKYQLHNEIRMSVEPSILYQKVRNQGTGTLKVIANNP